MGHRVWENASLTKLLVEKSNRQVGRIYPLAFVYVGR
jgi:hypothetical protein